MIDHLALVDHPISKQQVVEYICNCPGEDGESLILTLSPSFSYFSMESLIAMLLT